MIKKRTLPQVCVLEFVLVNTTYSYKKSVIQATRKSRVSFAFMYCLNLRKRYSSELQSDGSCVQGIAVSSSYIRRIMGWRKLRLLASAPATYLTET